MSYLSETNDWQAEAKVLRDENEKLRRDRRAVEQRTRLETLERVADYVLDQGDEVARRFGGREGARWREFFDALSAAIRALQPREAPKAEEQIQCPACQRGDWCPESAPPQPGREEGR